MRLDFGVANPGSAARGADPLESISLQRLWVFKVVADLGHFTRAADHLEVSQPVISGHIRKLEQKVGARLFRRAGRGVALTEAGQRVLRWATEVLVEASAVKSDLHKLKTGLMGEMTISSSPSVGSYALARIVCDFVTENADARIDLRIVPPSTSTTEVRSGACDFAVTLLDASQPTDDLTVEIVWYERYMLVCSQGSTWAKKTLSLQDLATIPLITGNAGTVRRSIEDDRLLELGVTTRQIVLECGHPEPVKHAVLRGLGCAFLFESVVTQELADGRMVAARLPELQLINPIFLAVRKRKMLSPLELKFINQLRATRTPGTIRPDEYTMSRKSR